MNLVDTLRWAEMVLWHLSHPRSDGRQRITAERMNEKLGWLRKFRKDVARWSRCQAIVSASLTFINQQGLYVGAYDDLTAELGRLQDADFADCEASQQMIHELTTLVADSEGLGDGVRGVLAAGTTSTDEIEASGHRVTSHQAERPCHRAVNGRIVSLHSWRESVLVSEIVERARLRRYTNHRCGKKLQPGQLDSVMFRTSRSFTPRRLP